MSGRVVTKEVIRSQGEAYTSEVRLRKCAESFAPPGNASAHLAEECFVVVSKGWNEARRFAHAELVTRPLGLVSCEKERPREESDEPRHRDHGDVVGFFEDLRLFCIVCLRSL